MERKPRIDKGIPKKGIHPIERKTGASDVTLLDIAGKMKTHRVIKAMALGSTTLWRRNGIA